MSPIRNYLWQCWRLMRGHQPTGFILLLAPTLWSLWLAAGGIPPLDILCVFVAGAWCMRAAGCVINDSADRKIDTHVKRTRERPLAMGALQLRDALWLLAILLVCAFALVLQTNVLTIMLACIALLVTFIYPFSKRWFYAPQVFLAISFSFAVPMSFASVGNHLPVILWWVYCANICWVIAYDTIYAMSDSKDDAALTIHSTALLLGKYSRLLIACMQIAFIAFLTKAGTAFGMGVYYYLGLAIVALLFVYQQWLISTHDARSYLRAFVNNGVSGMVIAMAIAVDFYMRIS